MVNGLRAAPRPYRLEGHKKLLEWSSAALQVAEDIDVGYKHWLEKGHSPDLYHELPALRSEMI